METSQNQQQSVTLRDLTRGNNNFCEDLCFGLTIATKSLSKESDSVYGLVLSDSKGNILFKSYFGFDVPDTALGYDRLNRILINETGSLSDAVSELLHMLPKGAKLFSSHANTWAKVIWQSMVDKLPTAHWDDTVSHLDIRCFAKAVSSNRIPSPETDIDTYCVYPVGSRVHLFEVASMFGIRDSITLPAPEAKAVAIGQLINALFNQDIKIPR